MISGSIEKKNIVICRSIISTGTRIISLNIPPAFNLKQMPKYGIPIWKLMPMLRMLIPLMAGILLQYYFHPGFWYCLLPLVPGCFLFLVYARLPNAQKFVYSWMTGMAVFLCFAAIGGCISYLNNVENHSQWLGKSYSEKTAILVTLQEPLIEKTKSYKALAKAESIIKQGRTYPVSGNLLLYFKKDSLRPLLAYGSQIVLYKTLQPITNSGNPGAFDYRQYCFFQHISYQLFVTSADYQVLTTTHTRFFDKWLIRARMGVLSILRKNIKDTQTLGLAEALLIGYRDDLDKTLIQSYSNTGVVHIIAISGLHLAMLYGLLLVLLRPFQRFRWMVYIKPVFILSILWGFSFIAGAAPSILRCTVMFTFIIIGETINKRSNIYNNLAASAFTILLFSPYSLWDVGFQLSYAAVLGIVLFEKHIQNSLFFTNKLLKKVWELLSITLSAQVLTLPIILYYFHQFPTLFLFTNLFAVPLSGLILYEELLLLVVSPLTPVSRLAGTVTSWCIGQMNHLITRVNDLPLFTLQGIKVSIPQTLLLYIIITGLAWWWLQKQNKGLILAFTSLFAFFTLRSIDIIRCNQQQKLIVYNIPHHQAIDLVTGRNVKFIGDSILKLDDFLNKYYLLPSRIQYRISPEKSDFPYPYNVLPCMNKKIILIDKPLNTAIPAKKIKADVIIISKNPTLYFGQLITIFDCKDYVFDATNSLWKINNWKKDCRNLHLHPYSIPEQGAFVMEL